MTLFGSKEKFIEYLKSTLIPDLKSSGSVSTAEDFEEAIYWMQKQEIKAGVGLKKLDLLDFDTKADSQYLIAYINNTRNLVNELVDVIIELKEK